MHKYFALVLIALPLSLFSSDWEQLGPGCGGGIPAIYPHPTNSDIVYCSADMNGLQKSVDGGDTWTHCNYRNGTHFMYLAFDPNDAETIYMPVWDGIEVSYDGAETWTQLATNIEAGYEPVTDYNLEGEINDSHISMPVLVTDEYLFLGLNNPDPSSNNCVWGEISRYSFSTGTWNSNIETGLQGRVRDIVDFQDNLFICSHDGISVSVDQGLLWNIQNIQNPDYTIIPLNMAVYNSKLYVYAATFDENAQGINRYPSACLYSKAVGEDWVLEHSFEYFDSSVIESDHHPFRLFDIHPKTGTMICTRFGGAGITFAVKHTNGQWVEYPDENGQWPENIDTSGQLFQRMTYKLGNISSVSPSPCSSKWFMSGSAFVIGSDDDADSWDFRVGNLYNSGFEVIRRSSINSNLLLGGQVDNELTYSLDNGNSWNNYSLCKNIPLENCWGGKLVSLEFDPWCPESAYALFTLGGGNANGRSQGGDVNRYLARLQVDFDGVDASILYRFPDIDDPNRINVCVHYMVLGNNENELFVATALKSDIPNLMTGVMRSTDGGETFYYAETGLGDNNEIEAGNYRVCGIAKSVSGTIILAVNNENSGALYQWDESSLSWFLLSELQEGCYFLRNSAVTSSADSDNVLAATYIINSSAPLDFTTRVILSQDGGLTWNNPMLTEQNYLVTQMWIAPFDKNTFYVNFIGLNSGHTDEHWNLYKSTDCGETWSDDKNGLIKNNIREFHYEEDTGFIWVSSMGTCLSRKHVNMSGVSDDLFITEPVLYQNYPNPFNPSTIIQFEIAKSEQATLDIYDVSGKKVICLLNQYIEKGKIELSWDGRNSVGQPLPSGIYFARLKADSGTFSQKMTLLK